MDVGPSPAAMEGKPPIHPPPETCQQGRDSIPFYVFRNICWERWPRSAGMVCSRWGEAWEDK